ncbi:hypothetical protein BJ138DRAFT_1168107 [Hygrophoropsis aurantiaca]|uniref:Uncharacterized protein n=1 Tax=Hygrophoropsis aurantiaca TaxID=72124 RepID=A0ACB7ZQF7_9AGAM|nr:hypothetical protein BJ138DRAFT_1168107 [Hygrophoropsis aurantiaca]
MMDTCNFTAALTAASNNICKTCLARAQEMHINAIGYMRWTQNHSPEIQSTMHFQLLVTGLFVFVPSVAVAQGWFETCQSTLPYVSGDTLYATCTTDSGAEASTSINLDACVANYGGSLACAAK